MANTRISDLTASASNLASTDLAPVVQTVGVGPVKMTGLQLAGGLLGSTTFNGSTVTTSSPVLNLTQTWNAGAVTFTGLKFNVTDTASASGSLLLDLQVGGASRFNITKAGNINTSGALTITSGSITYLATSVVIGTNSTSSSSGIYYTVTSGAGATLSFSAPTSISFTTGALNEPSDTIIRRAAAATLQLGSTDAGSVTATVTITIASPGVVTWGNHGISTGTPVFFTTTGALPTGITAGTTYYAIVVGASTFQIATSYANALAGTAVNTSGSQSGTQTGNRNAMAQVLRVQSVTGVTDRPGADFAIQGSRGTGTGAGGSIIFQVAPAGSSGTAQNAYATALTLNSSKQAIFDAGTVALPSILFRASDTIGIYSRYDGCITISDGSSVNMFDFANTSGSNGAFSINSGGFIQFCSGGAGSTGGDTVLRRDAANTLALRNGTSAQLFRVYSTYNGTNDAYGAIGAGVKLDGTYASGDENILYIGSQKKGSPTALTKLAIQVDGTTRLNFNISQTSAWTTSGAIYQQSPNTTQYSFIGAGNAEGYAGTSTNIPFVLYSNNVARVTVGSSGGMTLADANDIAVGTTTGTKIGTATSQKIGFWNAAPIVQPTTTVAAATVAATGVGDVVAASTTFDGYTIPQIVKAMRNAGLLA